nr:EOG090X0LFN [Lepidurus arcticus]
MANSGLVAYGVDSDEEVDKNSGGSASVKQPSFVGSRKDNKDKSSSKDMEGAPVIKSEKQKGSEAKRSSGSSDRDRDRRQDSDRSRVREDRHHRDTDKREGRHDDKRDRERRREDRFGGRDRRDDRRRRSLKTAKKDKPSSSAVWSATAFTQDQDGKVSAKFKRLMGIKNAEEENGPQEKPAEDLVKKQQELFANLDAQYAVARATTHTQRGVGLGFGSQSFSH